MVQHSETKNFLISPPSVQVHAGNLLFTVDHLEQNNCGLDSWQKILQTYNSNIITLQMLYYLRDSCHVMSGPYELYCITMRSGTASSGSRPVATVLHNLETLYNLRQVKHRCCQRKWPFCSGTLSISDAVLWGPLMQRLIYDNIGI